jgi:uncharacterized protein
MERKIFHDLDRWRNSIGRMPLVLHGARQVGKTHILKEFGAKYFDNVVYVNLETNVSVNQFFDQDISPAKIIQFLEAYTSERILPGKTLIVLDEIQSCERALHSLKYFCEDAPEFHVAAAGSLLGVAINRQRYSFPVGKVFELRMFPMDFEEFLWATGNMVLCEQISNHFNLNSEIANPLHLKSIELYQQYLICGGMPAVVKKFIDTNSLLAASELQGMILNEYIADMAKYSNSSTSVKIRACYKSIPVQLAKENKKFQYKLVQKGGTASIFGESIDWLISAGVLLKCQKIDTALLPLAAYADLSDFKLYMSDVGMLTMLSNMPHQLILSSIQENNMFLGAMAENFVAQELSSKGHSLFYWKNHNTAEMDFVLQIQDEIIPMEVKKGKRSKSHSLKIFSGQYNSNYAIRISLKNFGLENNIKSVPLYAVFCIK